MEKNKLVVIVFILLILVGMALIIILAKNFGNPTCDIGEASILGDFESSSSAWFEIRQCSIKDCNAYNKYHGAVGCVN